MFKDDQAAAKELIFLQSRVGNQSSETETDTSAESTAQDNTVDTTTDGSSEEN